MTNAEIAARLTQALEAAATQETGAQTALVSVEVTLAAPAADGHIETRLDRRTKTLAFLSAEFVSQSGARIAAASSVHKLR